LLVAAVGVVMLVTRVQEMRRKHIHPQQTSNSQKMAAHFENVQAADNLASFALLVGMWVAFFVSLASRSPV